MAARKKKKIPVTTGESGSRASETGVRVGNDARGSFSSWVKQTKASVQDAFAREALSQGLSEGPSVTVVKNKPGRNPHVGINIPETTNAEISARRRARKKKSKGTVRAVNRRK